MNQISDDPPSVHAAGSQVRDLAARLLGLAASAHSMAGVPVDDCFPSIPERQTMKDDWVQARHIFADGLGLMARGVDRLGSGLNTAADAFTAADDAATASMNAPRILTIDDSARQVLKDELFVQRVLVTVRDTWTVAELGFRPGQAKHKSRSR